MIKRLKLVLDIDQTLCNSEDHPPITGFDFCVTYPSKGGDEITYWVKKRPGLDIFLALCSSWFDVTVWTAATSLYAQLIVAAIFPGPTKPALKSREDCSPISVENEIMYVKDLRNLKDFDPWTTMIVDDNPNSSHFQPRNAIIIPPFRGEKDDKYLLFLLFYLWSLKKGDNVSCIEPHNWILSSQKIGVLFREDLIDECPEDYREDLARWINSWFPAK